MPSYTYVYPGIKIAGDNASITHNIIIGCSTGIIVEGKATIQANLITNNTGSRLDIKAKAKIENNTIAFNHEGIWAYSAPSVLAYNNFQNNDGNIYMSTANNMTAINNWWGTSEPSTINQSIHDFKNDFNLGSVTFTPFLTKPNTQAGPILGSLVFTLPTTQTTVNPTKTPTTTLANQPSATATLSPQQSDKPTFTPTPSVPEFPFTAILVVLGVFAITAAICGKRTGKKC
jgi:hypothetical protein